MTHSVGESGGVDVAGEGVGATGSSLDASGSGVGATGFGAGVAFSVGAGAGSLWGVTHAGCRTQQKYMEEEAASYLFSNIFSRGLSCGDTGFSGINTYVQVILLVYFREIADSRINLPTRT